MTKIDRSSPTSIEATTATTATTTRRTEWRPEPYRYPPVFTWPPRPVAAVRFIFAWGGYLLPWLVGYFLIALATWTWLTPSPGTIRDSWWWMLAVLLRNEALLVAVAGGWHAYLYIWKRHGIENRYDWRPFTVGKKKFLFRNQVRDNVFWSLVFGVPIWTAWEGLFLWLYAHDRLPMRSWSDDAVWCVAALVILLLWQEFHFYFVHRALHWRPIYRRVHSLHHKNVNIGPWSGLAMHPVEHVVFLSRPVILLLLPANPLLLIFLMQQAGLGPAQAHCGFHTIHLGVDMPAGSYFHWLHHRHFECNYGDPLLPLDRWFGTFRDGAPNGIGEPSRGPRHVVAPGSGHVLLPRARSSRSGTVKSG